MPLTALGPGFNRALGWAEQLHRKQRRKGTDIPYISHLLAVAALVLEDGGSETEAIAALLHDSMEDQHVSVRAITRRHGAEVARIVAGCTDGTGTPKPAWEARKRAHIDKLRDADESVLRVSVADKLHNARSQLTDLVDEGPSLWERFNQGAERQLWYHRELLGVFEARLPGRLTRLYRETVAALHEQSGLSSA
jgi:(p)ppGpp synthase/HD superfamily hydrolase